MRRHLKHLPQLLQLPRPGLRRPRLQPQSASPSNAPASPSVRPLEAKVTDAQYYPTSAHSGLIQISAENDEHTYAAEFNTSCRTGAAVIKVVHYIDGKLVTPLEDAKEHPDLKSIFCDGAQVAPNLTKNPADYAGFLLPLAGVS